MDDDVEKLAADLETAETMFGILDARLEAVYPKLTGAERRPMRRALRAFCQAAIAKDYDEIRALGTTEGEQVALVGLCKLAAQSEKVRKHFGDVIVVARRRVVDLGLSAHLPALPGSPRW